MALAALITLAATAQLFVQSASAANGLPPIHHVFIIIDENEPASTTFGPNSPAPYLSKTLRAEGAYLPNYYAIGHESNDNYVAMISGQAPNPDNQSDCLSGYDDFEQIGTASYGQAEGQGCIFPTGVTTIADQLDAAGLTWRDFNDGMGADPSREAAECGHPGVNSPDNTQDATASDQYATRHNPFVYFHSIIDDTTLCDTHVVNLDLLPQDLAKAADTPNYVFITPNLCDDGHDSPCANGQPGGLTQADSFLRQWVPEIVSSPAFQDQNGLLIITFDESADTDTGSCCGEIAGPNSKEPGIKGLGGGDVGAVLISPCITPGTVSDRPYNHYTMLRSVEDIFGLSHLGYAQLPGESSFGSDVFTAGCESTVHARAPALASKTSAGPRVRVRWRATGAPVKSFTVQVRRLGSHPGSWRTLLRATKRRSLRFHGRLGRTYQFRVRAIEKSGLLSSWAMATTVMPTGVHVPGGHYKGSWSVAKVRSAWEGHAIISSSPGSTFTLTYTGGNLAIIGDRWPQGGLARIDLDGHVHTIHLHSKRPHARQVLYRATVAAGRHHLRIRVLRGVVALEGFAITA